MGGSVPRFLAIARGEEEKKANERRSEGRFGVVADTTVAIRAAPGRTTQRRVRAPADGIRNTANAEGARIFNRYSSEETGLFIVDRKRIRSP